MDKAPRKVAPKRRRKDRRHALSYVARQPRYAAFAVSASGVPRIKQYMANHEKHHGRANCRQEYVAFLQRRGLWFDERHVLV
jgi:hypothetical protein